MAKRHSTATPPAERVTGRKKNAALNAPAIGGAAAKRLSVGIVIAMCAAAGISAQGQFQLGIYLGLGHLSWLMPVAFDVYAGTLTLVAVKVPADHPKRRTVVWNARLALAVSIAGNATSHAIKLGDLHHGWTLRDSVLVVISALPPVVVERLLHVYLIVNPGGVDRQDTAVGRQSDRPTDRQTDRAIDTPPVDDKPIDNRQTVNPTVNPVDSRPTGTAATDLWVSIGRPVYETVRAEIGKRPTEGRFHAALCDRVRLMVATGALPDETCLPSVSNAKRIRSEIERRFPDLTPVHLVDRAAS